MTTIRQKMLLSHKGISEKKPEGTAHWNQVVLIRMCAWTLHTIPIPNMYIDGLRVDRVDVQSNIKGVEVTMIPGYKIYDNVEAIKQAYPDWRVCE